MEEPRGLARASTLAAQVGKARGTGSRRAARSAPTAVMSLLTFVALATFAGSGARAQSTACGVVRAAAGVLEHVGRAIAIDDGLAAFIDDAFGQHGGDSRHGDGVRLAVQLLMNRIAGIPIPGDIHRPADAVVGSFPFYRDPVLVARDRVVDAGRATARDAATACRDAGRNYVRNTRRTVARATRAGLTSGASRTERASRGNSTGRAGRAACAGLTSRASKTERASRGRSTSRTGNATCAGLTSGASRTERTSRARSTGGTTRATGVGLTSGASRTERASRARSTGGTARATGVGSATGPTRSERTACGGSIDGAAQAARIGLATGSPSTPCGNERPACEVLQGAATAGPRGKRQETGKRQAFHDRAAGYLRAGLVAPQGANPSVTGPRAART
jgi:hypothetical protein